jgi:hypothetical protein
MAVSSHRVTAKIENVSEAFHAEIVACLRALQRPVDLRMQRVISETDANMIVQMMRSEDFECCSAGGLL